MSPARLNRALRPALIALAVVLSGCATLSRPVPEWSAADAPAVPVAAAFRTEHGHGRDAHTSQWRYWRAADRVTREWENGRSAETWQRDGHSVFRTVVFHDLRRGIEFEPADLHMTGAAGSESGHVHLVSPELLAQLAAGKSGWQGDVPWRDYAGERHGVRWRVRMRLDLQVPILVERTQGGELTRTVLLEAHPLAQAPWQPTPSEGYGMLDFADLGDHERDPFVLQAQARLGLGHEHAHP